MKIHTKTHYLVLLGCSLISIPTLHGNSTTTATTAATSIATPTSSTTISSIASTISSIVDSVLAMLIKLGNISINGVTLKATITQMIADKLNTLDPQMILKLHDALVAGQALPPEIPLVLEAIGITSDQLEGLHILETRFAPEFASILNALIDITDIPQAATSTNPGTMKKIVKIKSVKKLIKEGTAKPVTPAK